MVVARALVATLVATLASGCAVMQRSVVVVERGLEAGSDALDAAVDARIAYCRGLELPTPEERAQCVEKVQRASDLAEPMIELAVAALRAFWIAAAAGDKPGMAAAAQQIAEAVAALPEGYFAGVKKAAWRLKTWR